ncbi:MAG: hypothetical protein ABR564_01500 [Candidatus Dormibacteria bacterium]
MILSALSPVSAVSAETAISISQPPFAPGQCRAVLYCFGPQVSNGLTGSAVRWTNSTGSAHTATGDGFDVALGAGQTAGWTPTLPGTYEYRCRVWPDMKGTLVITEPPRPTPAAAPLSAASGRPAAATRTAPAPPAAVAPTPGAAATVVRLSPSPDPGAAPPAAELSPAATPSPSPRPASSAPSRSPSLAASSASSRRPTALYVIGGVLFLAVAGAAGLRHLVRWWRRVSADPLGDDSLVGLI